MNTALESFPNIAAPDSQTMRATGTDVAADFGYTNGNTRPAEISHSQPFLTGPMATDSALDQKRKNPRKPAENEGFEGVKVPRLERGTYGLKVRCSTN